MNDVITFQEIITNLTKYWSQEDCCVINSYDLEMGAGTLSPHTALRVLDRRPWHACYVQYSRRPTDARFAKNPNRISGYHQFQVILKPAPDNIQHLCRESLIAVGLNTAQHDIRFVEDDWENPSIGAAGLGFEVWCDGMEITQFTYMQRMGGIECQVIPGEITYGLERLAMYIQDKSNIYDIIWRKNSDGSFTKYSDIFPPEYEVEYSNYYHLYTQDNEMLQQRFVQYQAQANQLIEADIVVPGYEYCLKASHVLNILDSRKLLSHNERTSAIMSVRELVKNAATKWLAKHGHQV